MPTIERRPGVKNRQDSTTDAAKAAELARRLAGRFVVFDGPDGSGKSTQLAALAELLEAQKVGACVVREPGATPVGERVRALLLGPAGADETPPTPHTEMLLFMASRRQMMETVVMPALEAGRCVLCDRFVASTIAYQGAASGVPIDEIQAVADVACMGRQPDLTLIFDVDPNTAAQRVRGGSTRRTKKAPRATDPTLFDDRMEARGANLQSTVRASYLEQAQADPQRFAVIDAAGDQDTVFAKLTAELLARFTEQADG